MLGALLTVLVLAVMAIVAVAVVGAVVSLALGLASILLFKVAPLLLVGWLVLRLVRRKRGPRGQRRRISPADQRWLDA